MFLTSSRNGSIVSRLLTPSSPTWWLAMRWTCSRHAWWHFSWGNSWYMEAWRAILLAPTRIFYWYFPVRICICRKNREEKESHEDKEFLVIGSWEREKKEPTKEALWSSGVWNLSLEIEYMLSHRELNSQFGYHSFPITAMVKCQKGNVNSFLKKYNKELFLMIKFCSSHSNSP